MKEIKLRDEMAKAIYEKIYYERNKEFMTKTERENQEDIIESRQEYNKKLIQSAELEPRDKKMIEMHYVYLVSWTDMETFFQEYTKRHIQYIVEKAVKKIENTFII